MQYSLDLSQKAELSIYEAGKWYEQQRAGLGEEFLDAVDQAFVSIQSNPHYMGSAERK